MQMLHFLLMILGNMWSKVNSRFLVEMKNWDIGRGWQILIRQNTFLLYVMPIILLKIKKVKIKYHTINTSEIFMTALHNSQYLVGEIISLFHKETIKLWLSTLFNIF